MKSVISSLILGTLTGLSLISGAHAAQFTWWGGDADDLTETNWDIGIGIPVAILFSNSDITTDLYFGQYRDWDGIVRMDGFLHVDSLNFSGQNWDVNLSSLHMVTGDINVSSTSSVVNLNLVYGMSWGSAFGDGEMTINVDTGSQLNINGNAYGNGSLNKYGGGTTIITSPFNQERGSRIDGTNLYGGTLITDNPINDYNIREGTLLGFNIPNGWARGDLTFTSRIYGAGNFVKRGDATLTLAGDTSYTGFTTVEGGRLVISGSHYFSSGFIFDGGDLELRTTANTTYNSMINGTRSFTKSGIGTLTLTANNNYVGGVVSVTGGRLIESRPMGSNYNVTGNGELIFEVSSGSRNYSGALSGNAAFGKRGDGDLVISGTNTFTGATRIYDGRLFVDNLRGSYQIYSGSSLIFTQPSGANNLTYSGKIAGAGDLVKRGSGTLALTGDPGPDSDWSGTVRIEGGRLVDHHMRGDYVLGGSDAELEWVVDDWLSIINAGLPAELGIVGSISGTGNFTKSGSGTLVLFTKLNHSGDTKISGGELVVLENNTLPTSTNLTVSGDGTFMSGALRSHTIGSLSGSGSVILPTSTLTINSQKDATFSGVISDSTSQAGVVIKNGAGTQTFSGVNTYVGGTYINSGRLIDHNPHGNYVLSNGSNLEFANNEFLSIDTANKVTGNGHFTKSGAGGLYLESALGHSGRTTINEGLLVAGVWNALPTSTDLTVGTNGTYLSGFRTNQTIGSLSGSGTVNLVLESSLILGGAGNSEFSGEIYGDGVLVKNGSGTQKLSGRNSYTGGTFVNGGSLVVDQPYGNYTVSNGANLEYGSSGTNGGLTVNPGASFLNTSSVPVMIGGRTYHNGRMETSFGSTTAFNGQVTGAGSFEGNGLVIFGGGYSPGNSPADIIFEGDLVFESTNQLIMELGLSASDHITVHGTATLGGYLEILLLGNFSPSEGQSFDIFDFGDRNGTFSSVSLPILADGLGWDATQLYTTGGVSVITIPEPSVPGLSAGAAAMLMFGRRRKSAVN